MRTMTDEERRLVEENQKLVYFTLRKHFWGVTAAEWEEYVQQGMLGLCRAAMAWKPERGLFSTYASKSIEMAVRCYVRGHRAECRDLRKEACSLDAPVPGLNGMTYAQMIPAEGTVEDMLDLLVAREAVSNLRGRDKHLVEMMLAGYSQR